MESFLPALSEIKKIAYCQWEVCPPIWGPTHRACAGSAAFDPEISKGQAAFEVYVTQGYGERSIRTLGERR